MKKQIKKWLKRILYAIYKYIFLHLPIEKKRIIFVSSLGRNYTGSPRAIYEEMVRLGLDKEYACMYVIQDLHTKVPGQVKKIKKGHVKYYLALATARVIVSDTRLPDSIKKRKGTTYIQTWHGTPLKKLALDMTQVQMSNGQSIEEYHESFRKNASTWDYLIAQNPFSEETFRRCFAFEGHILRCGYPRNDVLFAKNNAEDIKKLKQKLGIPLDKKVLLYAPTWRDNQYFGLGKYKFATEMEFDRMQQALAEKYVLIVKYHYLVQEQVDWAKYKGFVYTCPADYDIAELYLMADALITDYSSVMFDYSILKRPMFFFAYDLEQYKNDLRGFYFDFLAQAPGPVVQTTDALIEAIQKTEQEEYAERYAQFCARYNPWDNGTASAQIVELLQKTICAD